MDLLDQLPVPGTEHYRLPEFPNISEAKELEIDFETDGLDWHNGNRPIVTGKQISAMNM